MPRYKNKVQREPSRILKKEVIEDSDEWYVEKWYHTDGITINRHPKHPERPKEQVLEKVGEIWLDALKRMWKERAYQLRQERPELTAQEAMDIVLDNHVAEIEQYKKEREERERRWKEQNEAAKAI